MFVKDTKIIIYGGINSEGYLGSSVVVLELG